MIGQKPSGGDGRWIRFRRTCAGTSSFLPCWNPKIMDGRAFLGVARELALGRTEAHWRAAVGRGYYALILEGGDLLPHWGFTPPPRQNVHTFVRLQFLYASSRDLKLVGDTLDRLARWRNQADYVLASGGPFGTDRWATQAVAFSSDAITLLDQIDADPARRAAA